MPKNLAKLKSIFHQSKSYVSRPYSDKRFVLINNILRKTPLPKTLGFVVNLRYPIIGFQVRRNSTLRGSKWHASDCSSPFGHDFVRNMDKSWPDFPAFEFDRWLKIRMSSPILGNYVKTKINESFINVKCKINKPQSSIYPIYFTIECPINHYQFYN